MTTPFPPGTEFGQYILGSFEGKSLHATVYKAFHKSNLHAPLALKILNVAAGSIDQSRYLTQKIERLSVLHDPRVSIPLSYETEQGVSFLVHPWTPGVPLDQWMQTHKICDLPTFFSLACSTVDILQVIHDTGIIHGGIKPHNILIQPETLNIWLTDFITPLDIRDVSHFIYDAGFVRDTLAYTSPEQTGRINHRVNFTTDLYSLGIVFYELLTGSLPFYSTDPLVLIHSHLAEEGPLVSSKNPVVPEQLASIIAKMIIKEPEKRYQSCSGLMADLMRCRTEFEQNAKILSFKLGLHDRTRRVVFISRMVGRDKESQLILKQYEEVVTGQFRSLFISGLSGIGKTRLIQELQKPLVRNRGYFTSGKFDQYQKNIPYSSLLQALRNLMRTFLTESDKQLADWKTKILDTIQLNGKVITDSLPELEYIIGAQPDVPELPPVEARNRFNNVFGQFLASLSSRENPLILFIDDLQWCDIATFDFIQFIFANYSDYPYLYFMGAYRHNEVDSSHPLSKLINAFKKKSIPIREIRINELDPCSSHEMVAYILDATLKETTGLAHFVTALTEGNPLFVSETLSYLYNENLLHVDENNHWTWDMARIRDTQMPATVVEMFCAKVKKLPQSTLRIIEHCACMGNHFTPEDLSRILQVEIHALFDHLKPVLSLGMLLENKNDLQFVHDRVQEAVLRNIYPRRRRVIHWRIGTRLVVQSVNTGEQQKAENLFTIASHLNQGKPKRINSDTLWMLIKVNFHAGNKALESLATDAANDFFRVSHALLPEDCWEVEYSTCFHILQLLAKTELMRGRYDESEKLINRLIDHARSDLDKAEALAEQTTSLSSVGNFINAIATANRGLEYFGKNLPGDADQAREKTQELMEKVARNGDVWSKILNMPFTQERRSKIELSFYSELIPDLYMSGMVPQLYLSAAQSTLHCLEGGMDESVIYSFSIMGLNLGEQRQFDLAFRYQDLAHELCERHPNTFGATRGMNGIVWCNMHSRSHPAEIVDYCHKAIQCGKNCGDLYNAGLSYGPLMWNLQIQGRDLLAVEESAEECLHFSTKNQLAFSVGLAEAVFNGWIFPLKSGRDGSSGMENKITQWINDNHVASAGSYFVLLGIAQFYLGQYELAETSLNRVHVYLDGLTDNVLKRQWMVFDILNRLRLHRLKKNRPPIADLIAEIASRLEAIRIWSELGPLLKPYYLFLQAELALSNGKRRTARNLYFDAIELAHANCYVLLEGFLHQSLAELKEYFHLGNYEMHYREALRLYQECHVNRLAQRLIGEQNKVFGEQKTAHDSDQDFRIFSTLPNLDLNYLMKSALAISEETNVEHLLKKVMAVLLESSGAQHGYLLCKQNNVLMLQAECHVTDPGKPKSAMTEKQMIDVQLRQIKPDDEICRAVVNFVFHTGEKIILVNAREQGAFTDAPEVQALNLCSLMCLPVFKQGKMLSVLYLDNHLSEGVFTSEKIDMTEMLMSHAAISLENARLLQETQQTEEELRILNQTLEKRVDEEVNKNRDKDLLMIQQSRLAAMGEMIGNIAHQWRQPLNALALVLANIQDAYQFNELDADYLESTCNKGKYLVQKMSTTINDFRDFFKSDKVEVSFSARTQILDAISLVDAAFKHSHIEIAMSSANDLSLFGFPNEYSQVILNLLSNAREAIQSRGVQGSVTIDLFTQSHYGCVAIRDNGGGVPEIVMNKIFDPYFSTKDLGTGIGLYMSKMIIEHHMKGQLQVHNTPEGAVFTICTPLAREIV